MTRKLQPSWRDLDPNKLHEALTGEAREVLNQRLEQIVIYGLAKQHIPDLERRVKQAEEKAEGKDPGSYARRELDNLRGQLEKLRSLSRSLPDSDAIPGLREWVAAAVKASQSE